jgi:hypothetical protein
MLWSSEINQRAQIKSNVCLKTQMHSLTFDR